MCLTSLWKFLSAMLIVNYHQGALVFSGEQEEPERPKSVSSSPKKYPTGNLNRLHIAFVNTYDSFCRISHVFWVDASSLESIIVSLIGLSGIPADEADSAESALRWISDIQEEWLIVFDNADHLPPDLVARFIPPGKRGNILITSRSQSMGRIIDQSKERIIAPENVIEIRNEPDGV